MGKQDDKLQEILTVPNMITLARLIMVPIAFIVLVATDKYLLAFFLFVTAALSDFLDGYIARVTDSVTEFGSKLDPLVDRFLLMAWVLALFIIGRLPLWIVIGLIARDLYIMQGAARMRAMGIGRVPVLPLGKIATGLLFLGFSGLIWGSPAAHGLGLTSVPWFPGLDHSIYIIWIWLVYIGFILSLITMVWYRVLAETKKKKHRLGSLPNSLKD